MNVRCPSCGNQVEPVKDESRGVLTCPRCEGEIPREEAREEAKEPDEIAPGLKRGDRLGPYEVLEPIGSGGMALVLKGRQLSLNRIVALKILPTRFASNKVFVERFYSEAAALAELNHPNIVNVIDRGRTGNIYYIVMEHIEGHDLRDRLAREGRLPPSEAIGILQQVLAALQYAHSRGVVHRDVKPANIMLGPAGSVKVTDFGLAHLTSERSDVAHTRTGQTMGTLKYMAPEQLRDTKNVDGRADLYSAGVVLYEMLTGQLPVGAFRMASEIVPGLDPRLDDVILKALRTEPDERFAGAEDFSTALQRILDEPAAPVEKAEEEFEVADEDVTVLRVTDCPQCGHENEKTARLCARCGADLSHLFEPCPECGFEVRVDVSTCPECDFDLKTWRRKARLTVMRHQKLVKQQVAEGRYDEALAELRKLANLKGFLYEHVRESARNWIPNIEKRARIRHRQLFEAARRMEAERNYRKAIELLDQLPKDFRGASELRAKAEEQLALGRSILDQAQEATRKGDLDEAIALWTKAAEVWPRDAQIQNTILELKNRQADRRMAAQYLREARQAAAKENYLEAIALCQRAQELMPDNEEAEQLLERYRLEQSAHTSSEARRLSAFDSSLEVPARRPRLTRAIKFGGMGLTALLLVLLVVALIPSAERRAAARAAEARALAAEGDLAGALERYRNILERYGDTPAAEEATRRVEELGAVLERCDAVQKEAEALFEKGDLGGAAGRYRTLCTEETLRASLAHRNHALERLAAIVRRLTDRGRKLAEAGALDEARVALESAESVALDAPADLVRLRAQIEKALMTYRKAIERARAAMAAGRLAEAETALAAAAEAQPSGAEARRLAGVLLARKPPPKGMVHIPPGPFVMGSDEGDPDEAPRRRAVIAGDYYLDVAEVTNAEYLKFVEAKGVKPPPHWRGGRPPEGEENLPVVNVTAAEAEAYAAWAGKRLPTEAEWERAARGADGRRYPWGDAWRRDAAVLDLSPSPSGTCEADAAPSGCREMAGNVAEWTADRYRDAADLRVVKGGSWAGPEAGRFIQPVLADLAPTPPAGGVAPPEPGPEERLPGLGRPPRARGRPGSLTAPRDPAEPTEPPAGETSYPNVLVDDAEHPGRRVLFERNLYMAYLGKAGSRERASVVIYKWLADRRRWVSAQHIARQGRPMGGPKRTAVPGADGRRAYLVVDYTSGCTFVGLKPDEEDVLIYRDPNGVRRELRRGWEAVPMSVRASAEPKPRALPDGPPSEGPPGEERPFKGTPAAEAPRRDLRWIPRGANRLKAPADGRYLNVGFRCAQTPRLLTLFRPAAPPAKATSP